MMQASHPRQKSGVERNATDKQLRGSSLLLAGKFIAVGVNFITQVLIVRFLSTAEYGAFAYALAAVAFFNHVSTLGLRTTVPRFVPIFHEKEEFGKIAGTILITIISILLTGLLIVGATLYSPDLIARLMNDEAGGVSELMLIMIFLVPVEALDGILIALFASFGSPRAIFFRKYILGPGLKLTVVTLMTVTGSDVQFIAFGYLAASLAGILLYSGILIRELRRQGIWAGSNRPVFPFKELFLFSASNFTTDMLVGLTPFAATFMLGYFHGPAEVAFFRVVLPLAHLNRIVKMSFETLYAPTAARLFARGDHAGLNDLYWRTALWMGVISFPVFLITFAEAKSATVLAYGARYEDSWLILALLSFAWYFVTLVGFNELTLKIVGKIGFVLRVRIVFTVLSIGANAAMIFKFGATGAAIATSAMMIIQALVRHWGLRMVEGVHLFEMKYLSFFAFIAGSAAVVFAIQLTPFSNIFLMLPLAAAVSIGLLYKSKRTLKIAETFPEIMKIPLAKRLFS